MCFDNYLNSVVALMFFIFYYLIFVDFVVIVVAVVVVDADYVSSFYFFAHLFVVYDYFDFQKTLALVVLVADNFLIFVHLVNYVFYNVNYLY